MPSWLHACNGAVLLVFAVWWVAMFLLLVTESPTHEDVRR